LIALLIVFVNMVNTSGEYLLGKFVVKESVRARGVRAARSLDSHLE
jgi:hypothetical protein